MVSNLEASTLDPIAIEILSERVVALLDRQPASLSENQDRILQKAEDFLRLAARGQERVVKLSLSSSDSQELNAAVWASKVPPITEADAKRALELLNRLAGDIANIRRSGHIAANDLQVRQLRIFFFGIENAAASLTAGSPDVVEIG